MSRTPTPPTLKYYPGIDTNTFTSNYAVGGKGGSDVTSVDVTAVKSGATMTFVECWAHSLGNPGQQVIRGLHATFSDGSSVTIGKQEGDTHDSLTIGDSDGITNISLRLSTWIGTSNNHRLGFIHIKTSSGNELKLGEAISTDLGSNYAIDVGSQKCAGVFGAGGRDVDCLGFAMLR